MFSICALCGTHRATSAPAPAAVLPATGAPGRAEPADGRLVAPSAAHVGRAHYREGGESPLSKANARCSAEKGVKMKLMDNFSKPLHMSSKGKQFLVAFLGDI